MKTLTMLMALLVLVGCRTRTLAPLPAPLGAHLVTVGGSQDMESPASTAAPDLEAKITVIIEEWNNKLSQPDRLVLLLSLDSERDVALREAAREKDFAATLTTGLEERQLIVSAFERSPRIRAAYLMLRASVNQYAQVTYLDTILSQYASFQRSSQTRVGMPLSGDRIDQSFPFPGTQELKAALVKHSVEEARARYAGTVRDIVVEARVLFARYVFAGRAIAISEATLQYLEQLEDAARGKLESGTGTKAAMIQVQVEVSHLRNQLVTLRQDETVFQADIARLLDVAPSTRIGPPAVLILPSMPTGEEQLREVALRDQPDVQIIEARVRRMQTMIELAEQTAYPPLSIGLSTMEGVSHDTGGSDRVREPFSTRPKIKPDPWFGTKDAYLREAREASRAAQSRARAVRNRTVFAVQRAYASLGTAYRLHRLYRDVQLAQAEQAYRDAAAGYATDRVEFLNVVDSLRRWLRFRLEADRAARDLVVSHARLEGAVGRTVPTGEK